MRLLLDEIYPAVLAEQLRARGHDVASLHDPGYRELEGQADEDVWASAIANERALVTENVGDFRRVEALALARGEPTTRLILTTDRQFPRGDPQTAGRLVLALDELLTAGHDTTSALFLKPAA
jgi:predicted nuclease of predicted toxin-antitoxin system